MAIINCAYCSRPCTRKYLARRFCSTQCATNFRQKTLIETGKASKSTCRRYLLKHREYQCQVCSLRTWKNAPINLQVDHIDGNTKNSLPENLRWICPNCHSQTETWGFRNVSKDGFEQILKGLAKGRKTQRK